MRFRQLLQVVRRLPGARAGPAGDSFTSSIMSVRGAVVVLHPLHLVTSGFIPQPRFDQSERRDELR